MHGLQVNRDFIEKQHGRMNLLQPIIFIVRQRNGYVKDLKTCFLKKHGALAGKAARRPNWTRQYNYAIMNANEWEAYK